MWWISERRAVLVLRGLALASALAACAAMLWYGRSLSALLNWFSLWVLAPSLAAYALSVLMPRGFTAWPLLALVGAALALGPVLYVLVALGPSDAQNALVFAIAPVWQLIGIGLAMFGAAVVAAVLRRREGMAAR